MDYQRYTTAGEATIATIRDLNRRKRPNILFAGLAITIECAQVGYLLDALHGPQADRVTYFGNSLEEAVSGAIRLVRQASKVDDFRSPDSWILVVDHDGRLSDYFDPLAEGGERALARHLSFVPTAAAALAALKDRQWSAVLILADGGEDLDDLLAAAADRRIMRILCDTRPLPPAGEWQPGRTGADVYVYGENLTDYQVPFGCYVMTPDAYRVWNNPVDAMAQTSTFAASATALTLVVNTLRDKGSVTAHQERVLTAIENDRKTRNEYFRRYVNPSAADMMEAFGLDFDFDRADGMEISLRDGRSLLDCACGTGANLRGHNLPDLDEALAAHQPDADYVGELAEFLCERSGFDEVFPAVSGATSVENALVLARLALPDRPRIVTFAGNFSGKTITTLNVSRYGPQRSASIPGAFEPYYSDVVFVDPFAPTAARDLRSALDDPQVGLFWGELIQGTTCEIIPPALLSIVAEAKAARGFIVGVDEVLTGVWRSADTFLYHEGVLAGVVDIVTLAKPLSDMIIPVAATLARAGVVADAEVTNTGAVQRLRSRYRNNLGAHIAVNALRAVDNPASHEQRRTERETLLRGLQALTATSPLIRSVEGAGAHVRIDIDRRCFPFRENTVLSEMVDQSIEDLILRRCGVILGRGRFFPPIFPPAGAMADVVERLQRGFDGFTVATVYANLVRNIAAFASFGIRRQVGALVERVAQLGKGGKVSVGDSVEVRHDLGARDQADVQLILDARDTDKDRATVEQ